VKPVALRNLQPGTVVYAHVPFADGTGSKARPAVVLRADTHTVDVAPITSRDRRDHPAYTGLSSWRGAGLSRPSFAARQVIQIPRSAVYSVVGTLTDDDFALVARATCAVGSSSR
jgi:mRNA-degrading endonuclease toxin of MazEF toxin-antitoxin module